MREVNAALLRVLRQVRVPRRASKSTLRLHVGHSSHSRLRE
jgi:hypothetical protein